MTLYFKGLNIGEEQWKIEHLSQPSTTWQLNEILELVSKAAILYYQNEIIA